MSNQTDGVSYTAEQQDVMPDLDPQLQHILIAARRNPPTGITFEIDVSRQGR